ncbi:MAG TPA: stage II sporulation protein M [Mycobacteriales bacterium]|nr:stage II sporulation protein M [Mycobacteriales bacterium]
MDLDAYVAAHAGAWRRLAELTRRAARPRRLTGAEVDELVELYQRSATHLSVVRSSAPDAALVARLSTLVARARAAVTGASPTGRAAVTRFAVVTFPAAVYSGWRWSLGTACGFLAVAAALGVWVAGSADVQASIAAPREIRRLVEHDFADYYSAHPAAAFAAQVWTNNAWVTAGVLCLGILLGLPTLWILWQNAANVGLVAGLMAAHGKLDVFLGLITPHGLLELTAVFVAAGTGLRLGWTVVDPGPRTRAEAVGAAGRAAVTVALGLVAVLLVSGAIEGFVTPSPLPTAARVLVGVTAQAGFLVYVAVLGRRAVAAGDTGDLPAELRGDALPAAG